MPESHRVYLMPRWGRYEHQASVKDPLPAQLLEVGQTWKQEVFGMYVGKIDFNWMIWQVATQYSWSTCHSGTVELSKLNSLSRWVSLSMCSLYLLLLNISSAFCMLKEQHMPRLVGNNVKILEQSSFTPFQEHCLIIPRIRMLCIKVSSLNTL